MGYNQENYRRVREKYRNKYLAAYAVAEKRMLGLHAASPEIRAIDRKLAATSAQIALAVIGAGEGYKERLQEIKEKN